MGKYRVSVEIKAIATPGHTDNHMGYLVNDSLVLTGDALFVRGCGRTDFQSADAKTLYHQVTKRLFVLADETLVYPQKMKVAVGANQSCGITKT